jgi:methylenetetrahydrofolate reductase (NADH)
MASDGAKQIVGPSPAERLLAGARFEVIPLSGVEQKVMSLPPGSTVTVTASPRHGIERTLEVSEHLSALGYRVVPHLAARDVGSPGQLEAAVERLRIARIGEAFVIGGDAAPATGPYHDAGDLLEALDALPHPLVRIGIAGHPEGHPTISGARLLDALRRKQPHADYIATQICFDPEALVRWVAAIREAGIELPVIVGLPGPVERHKLAEVSLRAGVGASLRYLVRHGRRVAALARTRRYDPTALALGIAAHLDDPGVGIAGVHLFTFNRIEATQAWVWRMVSEEPGLGT